MDRSLKIILGLIAAGLWANALPALLGRPAEAQSRGEEIVWLGRIATQTQEIARDVNALATGLMNCKNPKLCP